MSAIAHEETEEVTFNLSRKQLKLMVMLAKEKGITVEQLMKDILTAKASEMIADARTFTLSPDEFEKFEHALDDEPESIEARLAEATARPNRWG